MKRQGLSNTFFSFSLSCCQFFCPLLLLCLSSFVWVLLLIRLLWSCLACWTNGKQSITSFSEVEVEGKVHFLPGQGVVLALSIIRWVGKIYVMLACDQRQEKRKIWECEMGRPLFDQFTLSYSILSSGVVVFFPWKCIYHRGVSLICTWLSLEQKVRSAFAVYRICKERATALRAVIGTNLHGEGNRATSRRTVIRLWSSFTLGRGH